MRELRSCKAKNKRGSTWWCSSHGYVSLPLRNRSWKKGKHFNTISDWAVFRLDCVSGKIQSFYLCPLANLWGLALQDFGVKRLVGLGSLAPGTMGIFALLFSGFQKCSLIFHLHIFGISWMPWWQRPGLRSPAWHFSVLNAHTKLYEFLLSFQKRPYLDQALILSL